MKRYDWKKRFIQEKARFNKGYGEISWVKGIYEMFILLYIAASIMDFPIPNYVYIIAPVLVFLGLWLIGYMWDKTHLFNVEQEFSNSRNNFVEEMRKAIEKR